MKESIKLHISGKLSNWRFILMMMLCIVVWAFAFPFIKIALNDLSYINLTIMRFFVVCIFLLGFLLLKNKKMISKLKKRDIILIFILGFFGIMVYHLGLNYGEKYISAGAASLIIATIPVFILILASIFLNEKITLKEVLGSAIALCGVLVISLWGKQDVIFDVRYISGLLAVLIAALMGAFYTVAGKKLLERYSAVSLTTYAMLLGSIGLLPFINDSLLEDVSSMSLTTWIAIIFLGLFSTVVGYTIWYEVLKIKTASKISNYLYAIPVLSTVISYLFLGEKITILFVFGGALVIIGLFIANSKEKNL